MLPVLNIGPLALYAPGVIALAGAWLSLQAIQRAALAQSRDGEQLAWIGLIALVAGLIGARIGYAAASWRTYLTDPWALLARDWQAFSLPVGIVVTIATAGWLLWRRRWPLWPTLDALAPGMAILALTHALAQLASGDGYGLPTELPWAIDLWGARRHPTQLYAALTALIALIVWRLRYRRAGVPGHLFLTVSAILATGTLIGEGFAATGWLLPGRVRFSQALALAALVFILYISVQRSSHHRIA